MEKADKYQPDLLLFDDRNYPGNLDELPRSSRPRRASRRSRPRRYTHLAGVLAAHLLRLRRAAAAADRGDRRRPTPTSAMTRRRRPASRRSAPGQAVRCAWSPGWSLLAPACCWSPARSASPWAHARSRSARSGDAFTDFDRDARLRRPWSARCGCRARCSARRGRGARAQRRDPAGRHPQPARRPGHHGHQRGRRRRDRARRSWCSASRARRATYGSRSWAPAPPRCAVYAIASFGREGATPVKLALAGAAVTAGALLAHHRRS